MPWTPSRLTKAQLEERRTLAFERLDTGFSQQKSHSNLMSPDKSFTSGKPFLTRTAWPEQKPKPT